MSKQAGAELGQAQLKPGLDFTPFFCRFIGFSGFSFYCIGLIEKNFFGIFGLVYLILYISNTLHGLFNFVDSVF